MEAVEKGKTKLDEFFDAVVNSGKSADELLQEGGLLKKLFTRVAERALEAEMALHLGYEKHVVAGRGSGNSRNGRSRKRVLTTEGEVELGYRGISPAVSSRGSSASTSARRVISRS